MTTLMPVREIAELRRRWIEPDPTAEYVQIGVRGFGRGIFHYPPTAGLDLGRLRFERVEPGDFVVSNIKAWEGAIDVAGEPEAGCIASNRFLTYRVNPRKADARFLRYYFLSDAGLRLIGRASPGSADRNRTLSIDRFEALEIPLPAIDEQRRIAAYLSRAFELREQVVAEHARQGGLLAALMPSALRSLAEDRSGRSLSVGGDIEVASGGTPATHNPDFWGGDVVWVTPADMGRLRGREIVDSERHITAAG
ncbi:MAG: restriction endonuclease subunit S, partial [Actinobacteria bacterium]|nr:restriction endonuclease subunit S [Actinomycetota bacterium]